MNSSSLQTYMAVHTVCLKTNGKSTAYVFLYDDFSDEDCLRSKITPNTKAVFIETPTNPLMQEADIQKIAKIAKEHGALVIVDNTFYTPVLQKPITLGADIVIHSATKYLGGHNDVLAGLVVTKRRAAV
ncbi:hypothetical protein BsIDN1_21970 [Bacillus safensis]|uniref:Cystathionine gamma-synthase n=1 Tax=Bacillus safensis TaxID=561879 RepID=A0A5S9M9F1_BACIA|nr:hypothetical protein BsIDN1_21970 [Bacillus safensis]